MILSHHSKVPIGSLVVDTRTLNGIAIVPPGARHGMRTEQVGYDGAVTANRVLRQLLRPRRIGGPAFAGRMWMPKRAARPHWPGGLRAVATQPTRAKGQ